MFKNSLQFFLAHLRCIGFVSLSLLCVTGAAQATTLSYSVSHSGSSVLGEPGVFSLTATNLDTSSTGPVTISGITPFDFGHFVTAASNANVVSSNWNLSVSATVTSGTSVQESFSFTGSVTSPTSGVYDVDFSSPANTTYTYVNYPTTGTSITFATEDVTFGSLGTYTFGIETGYPINGMTKSTPLYAFIKPATPTVPEPFSAGLTGISMLGFLGFAVRRKFRTARS